MMPSGSRPGKASPHHVNSMPFPTSSDTAASSINNKDDGKSVSGRRSRSGSLATTPNTTGNSRRNTQSIQTTHTVTTPGNFFPLVHHNPTILAPHCGLDTVALIFIFSTLPTWISCIVLGSYILLGSFKSLASKAVAKWLFDFGQSVLYSLEASVSQKNKYYKSELIGQFLQLFSINSFILLLFHYTFPESWNRYLTILAKAIVASRLVGTYTTGSTTYVSVVSNSASTTTTTTTTTTSGAGSPSNLSNLSNPSSSLLKSERKYSTNSFLNSLVSCITVIVIDFGVRKLIVSWDHTVVKKNLILFVLDLLCGNVAILNLPINTLIRNLFSIIPDDDPKLLFKNPLDEPVTRAIAPKAPSYFGNFLLYVASRYLKLGNKTIQSVAKFLQELSTVVHYAYLVLCIHVVSLTIAPFLRKVFILKDYLRTLDQLSALTPDIPYGGLKKGGVVSGVTRDSASNAVVVINVEQNQQNSSAANSDLKVIKVQPSELRNFDYTYKNDIAYTVSAENFKNFCLVPPTNKTSSVGTRTNHSKTIVDRKKAATNSIPSTTIMDKYFTISIQPLWSWLAALKIIATEPLLFAGLLSKKQLSRSISGINELNAGFRSCVSFVEKSCILFEIFDAASFDFNTINIEVNGIRWSFFEFLTVPSLENNGQEKTYICVFCLAPMCQYEIRFCKSSTTLESHFVRTPSEDGSILVSEGVYVSQVDTLRASLLYTVSSLEEMKQSIKKAKKDENKRIADLRKQLETLKIKFDKYKSADSNEARFSSKVKGLQNSVTQLEAEIKDLEEEVENLENPNTEVDEKFTNEKDRLVAQIAELEEYIHNYEAGTSKLKQDAKLVEGDKTSTEMKLKKLENKLQGKRDELQKLSVDLKLLKKSLTLKVQKKQKKIHERYELIIPQILDAANKLTEQKAELQ